MKAAISNTVPQVATRHISTRLIIVLKSPLNECTVLAVYCSSILNFSYPLLSTEHCSLHVLYEYRKALDLTLDDRRVRTRAIHGAADGGGQAHRALLLLTAVRRPSHLRLRVTLPFPPPQTLRATLTPKPVPTRRGTGSFNLRLVRVSYSYFDSDATLTRLE